MAAISLHGTTTASTAGAGHAWLSAAAAAAASAPCCCASGFCPCVRHTRYQSDAHGFGETYGQTRERQGLQGSEGRSESIGCCSGTYHCAPSIRLLFRSPFASIVRWCSMTFPWPGRALTSTQMQDPTVQRKMRWK